MKENSTFVNKMQATTKYLQPITSDQKNKQKQYIAWRQ